MIRKPLLAIAAGAFLVSAAPPEIDFAPVPMFTYLESIKLVICGYSRGSAWYFAPTVLASVNHVTGEPGCKVDNEPLQPAYADAKLDFSETRTFAVERRPIAIDCEGFQENRVYVAAGYAHGKPIQRTVVVSKPAELIPGVKWDDNVTLVGAERFIPGMSGAPVMDAITGKAVGLVKGYNEAPFISYAVELKGTPLCQH